MREGVKNGDERMVKNGYGRSGINGDGRSGTNRDEEVVQMGNGDERRGTKLAVLTCQQ